MLSAERMLHEIVAHVVRDLWHYVFEELRVTQSPVAERIHKKGRHTSYTVHCVRYSLVVVWWLRMKVHEHDLLGHEQIEHAKCAQRENYWHL